MSGHQTKAALETYRTTVRKRSVNEQLATPHRERERSTWR